MPQTLVIDHTPSVPNKRHRSRDSRHVSSRPGSSGRDVTRGDDAESSSVPSVRLPAYLSKSRFDIGQAFQELEWKQRFRLQHAHADPESSPYRMRRTMDALTRNRYTNVQAWEGNRVRLQMPLDGSDYINASPIVLKSQSSSLADSRYVATQGPKAGQFSHFWNLVMQESVGDVAVIVMLTPCYEGFREKCAPYFPSDLSSPTMTFRSSKPSPSNGQQLPSGSSHSSAFSHILNNDDDQSDAFRSDQEFVATELGSDQDIRSVDTSDNVTGTSTPTKPDSVTLLSLKIEPSLQSEVRKMRLTIGDQSKEVWHYLFHSWPDYGKPEDENKDAVVRLVRETAERAGSGTNPRFVHCSAGVGRTGTFVAIDHLLRELEQGQLQVGDVNKNARLTNGIHTAKSNTTSDAMKTAPDPKEDIVFDTVNALRDQRIMMVANEIQLAFVYEVVKEAFLQKYTNDPSARDAGSAVLEPNSKVAKTADTSIVNENLYAGTKVMKASSEDEDPVSDTSIDVSDLITPVAKEQVKKDGEEAT